MIRVLLFDVDGVLANGEAFSSHLERDYGISPQMTASFFQEKFMACLTGSADLKTELAAYLVAWGWSKSVEAFLDYWFTCEHIIDQPLVEYVQQLRQQGVRCYIATQQEKYRTAYILEQMGFAQAFDGMFSSAQLGVLKNDQTFFTQILQTLDNIAAEEILFWDDTARNVTVARQTGMHAELYTDFPHFQQTILHYDLATH
ncbi:haloacid dehalogenase [Dictyobacter vulcani]|uniref:Haloacid dehalogenase n=1 Tax=Dictyobacter vulcani TaxID=2607529 RepID=A0A5J4KJH1_9CHLR|nr:HAD-IA family hydrolase [Dictyobacter vulcani]GER87873.1 haloacid dehalogenase [Dictyobacter vulcani]